MHTTCRPAQDEETRLAALQSEIDRLQEALGDEDAEKIVNKHIKLLHDYNEAKDAAQRYLEILIGRLAVHKETTVKQLHQDYGLSPED